MRKLLVIITVIILAFTFFYSCTTQVEKPNDSRIEKPDPDQDPEPEPEPEELPDTPNNLRATSVTYDTIVLEWDTVSNATEYKVVLKHMSGNTIQEFIVSENTFEFTRRNSGMWYDLEVWSGDSESWSELPATISVQTPEAYGTVTFDGRNVTFWLSTYASSYITVYLDFAENGFEVSEPDWRVTTEPLLTGWHYIDACANYRAYQQATWDSSCAMYPLKFYLDKDDDVSIEFGSAMFWTLRLKE